MPIKNDKMLKTKKIKAIHTATLAAKSDRALKENCVVLLHAGLSIATIVYTAYDKRLN